MKNRLIARFLLFPLLLSIQPGQAQLNTADRDPLPEAAPAVVSNEMMDAAFFEVVSPLNWLDVEASRSDNCISVKWITATQINVSHFRVEYSRNGRSWKKAEEETRAYSIPGISHYLKICKIHPARAKFIRVRVNDFDGSSGYSPVVRVTAIAKP